MISLSDIVTLAKAGWTPHQIKEVFELCQTVPEAKEAEVKEKADGQVAIEKKEVPEQKPEPEVQDDMTKLVELLKEE